MKRPATVRVLFDTTTLCAAIQSPFGLSMALLDFARIGSITGVVTQEVIGEWVRKCRLGIGSRHYNDQDIAEFCELLDPLLAAEMLLRVDIGRAMSPLHPITKAAGVTIVQAQPNTRSSMIEDRVFGLKDIGDLHVVRAALQESCDYLCSYNGNDLPDGLRIGKLEVIRPERLLPLIRVMDD
jgi:hypothetical protein